MAKKIQRIVSDEYGGGGGENSARVEIMHQDEYFLTPEQKPPPAPELNHYNYECPESLRMDDMTEDLGRLIRQFSTAASSNSVLGEKSTIEESLVENSNNPKPPKKKTIIIVEGIMLYCHEPLRNLFDKRYFIFGTYEECKRIRQTRTDYEPPDPEGYFDAYVWPYAVRYEQEARRLADDDDDDQQFSITFFPMQEFDRNLGSITMDIRKWLDRDWLQLTKEPLDLHSAVQFVTEPSDGAVAVFCGVTRDTFQGKAVVQLEYEAYEEMAYAEMRKLCAVIRSKWTTIDRVAIHHRLGIVPVSQTSVIIAISCPHRREAQEACALAIDHLKAHVPIWKKETYADGSGTWKENPECSILRN